MISSAVISSLCAVFIFTAVSARHYWINPCGHVYRKHLLGMRFSHSHHLLIALEGDFRHLLNLLNSKHLIDDTEFKDLDFYNHAGRKLDMNLYSSLQDESRIIKEFLPDLYYTMQHLAFPLHIAKNEIEQSQRSPERREAIIHLTHKNAEVICRLDLTMRTFGVEFDAIDQITVPEKWDERYEDNTFSNIKHNHILAVFRKKVEAAHEILKSSIESIRKKRSKACAIKGVMCTHQY